MLKLKKIKAPSGWNGNHVEQHAAEWALTDYPHIVIRKLGDWVAFDTTKPEVAPRQGFQRIATGWTRAMLCEKLQAKLNTAD